MLSEKECMAREKLRELEQIEHELELLTPLFFRGWHIKRYEPICGNIYYEASKKVDIGLVKKRFAGPLANVLKKLKNIEK